jgi:KamA family protein
MCFPSADELVVAGAMGATTTDPYGDDKHDKGNGVLHKYDCTALLITTERCAMHCRHCFRRRMVGHSPRETLRQFAGALDYIAAHKEINNVILSGGDPLTLDTPVLETMLEGLASLDHVAFARIGTRVPVTYPLRLFDQSLTDALRRFAARKGLYIATHYNHPREITPTSAAAIERIRLVRGRRQQSGRAAARRPTTRGHAGGAQNGLLAIGVNPYYVYQCMPVARAAPFSTAAQRRRRPGGPGQGHAQRLRQTL